MTSPTAKKEKAAKPLPKVKGSESSTPKALQPMSPTKPSTPAQPKVEQKPRPEPKTPLIKELPPLTGRFVTIAQCIGCRKQKLKAEILDERSARLPIHDIPSKDDSEKPRQCEFSGYLVPRPRPSNL